MTMHHLAEAAFDDLLTAWRRHDDLVRVGARSAREQFESRVELEQARDRMKRLRHALHPTPGERESAAATVLCSALDEVVNLTAAHQEPGHPPRYRCICGELIKPDHEAASR